MAETPTNDTDPVLSDGGGSMTKGWMFPVCAILGGLLLWPAGAAAQWTRADEGWCDGRWGNGDRDRYCFALEGDIDDPSRLTIDGGMNGGVIVEGWSRDGVSVRARVWANARSMERARQLAEAVRVSADGGRLRATGPDTGRRESWGVSWEVRVPRDTDLDVETHNGGIDVADVRGRIRLDAVNGGVDLRRLGGDVSARTRNGGLDIELEGSRWNGEGLDAETRNGGLTLIVPDGYSARLETGTVNGGMDIDFPVTVQGRIGRRLSTTLGEGGPTVRAITTNGGVEIRRGGRAIR
jgi:hypothetical protein